MPLYGGIDLHANNSVVVLLKEQDQRLYHKRLPNDLATIVEQLAPYHADIEGLVVESTYNSRLGRLLPTKKREEYRRKTGLFRVPLVSFFTAIACVGQLSGSPEKALTPAEQSYLDSP